MLTVHFLQTVAHSLYGGRACTTARPIADKDVIDGGENMPLAVKPASSGSNNTNYNSSGNNSGSSAATAAANNTSPHSGHDHGALLMLQEKRVIAYAVEFGVATHR